MLTLFLSLSLSFSRSDNNCNLVALGGETPAGNIASYYIYRGWDGRRAHNRTSRINELVFHTGVT